MTSTTITGLCVLLVTHSFVVATDLGAQTISQEARRHFDRGIVTAEMARSLADYLDSIVELRLAARFAPDWPLAYYNLGKVQERLGRYSAAIRSYKKYLQLAPNANDTEAVRSLIIRLTYKTMNMEALDDYSGRARHGTGKTPLMVAITSVDYSDHYSKVKSLIAAGADVNADDQYGHTPLHMVSDKDIAELLIAKGADVTARNKNGQTPLHLVSNKDVAELLITKGADVNVEDKDGWTPLGAAITWSHRNVAGLLIVKGADVNAEDEIGWTPLHRAADLGQKDVAELLIAKGADVNAKNWGGDTPLHTAAQQGQEDLVELLIAKGADVGAKNSGGGTALHTAARRGQKEVAELLIAKGADVNARDQSGYTPLHKVSDQDMAELLKKHGAVE